LDELLEAAGQMVALAVVSALFAAALRLLEAFFVGG
jgi:hypothetical protein